MLLAVFLSIVQASSFEPRVANGQNAIRGQFPFIAHIQVFAPQGALTCTGSLIGPSTVLTNGDCCGCRDGSYSFIVTLNAYEAQDGSFAVQDSCTESFSLSSGECDPSFSFTFDTNYQNDFCILRLPRPSIYTPITLYDSNVMKMSPRADAVGKKVVLAGFGKKTVDTPDTPYANKLQKTQFSVFNTDACVARWEPELGLLNKSKIVCGDVSNRKGGCSGDGGAPLFTKISGRFLQVGVLSFGKDNCDTNRVIPGVYGKVDEEAFKTWISPILLADQTPQPTKRPSNSPTLRPTKSPPTSPTVRRPPTARSPTTRKPTTARPTRFPTAPTIRTECISTQFP